MISTYIIPLMIIGLLILLNGLFVAAEFAVVTASRTKLHKAAEEGSAIAAAVLKVVSSPDSQNRFITTAQVGITLVSLGLGMYGEHVFAEWLVGPLHELGHFSELVAHSLATVLAVSLLTYFHVVLGEMIPKSYALQTANSTIAALYYPMQFADRLFTPLVLLLNRFSVFALDKLGFSLADTETRLFTPDDLEFIVEESMEGELLDSTDHLFIENILDLEERFAEQVMTPRNRIIALPVSATADEVYDQICETNKTRYPIYEDTLERIIGIVHIKDIARWQVSHPEDTPDLKKICRPAIFIPEALPLNLLLTRFRDENEQLAIVLDEFGGVAGLVSIEDLIEEVVGEIQDEFDHEELPIDELDGGILRVRGDVILGELEQHYNFKWDQETKAITISGLVMASLGDIPRLDDQIVIGNASITVEEIEGMAVKTLLMKIHPGQPETKDPD
jgi:CBS domain containing-hemolysin-like protein